MSHATTDDIHPTLAASARARRRRRRPRRPGRAGAGAGRRRDARARRSRRRRGLEPAPPAALRRGATSAVRRSRSRPSGCARSRPALRVARRRPRFDADLTPRLLATSTSCSTAPTRSRPSSPSTTPRCAAGVPLVHAGALGFRGPDPDDPARATACYRCVFEEPPPPDDVPSCQEAGVLGPVGRARRARCRRPRRSGSSAGERPLFADRLLHDRHLARAAWRSVAVTPRPSCPTCAHAVHRSLAGPHATKDVGMSYVKGLRCRECGGETPIAPLHVCETCFGPLEVVVRLRRDPPRR